MEQILCPRTCMHIVTQNVQELQYQLLFTGSIGDFLKGDCQALSFHVVYLGLHLGGAGLLHSSSHTLGGHFGGLVDRWRTVKWHIFSKGTYHTANQPGPILYIIIYYILQPINSSIYQYHQTRPDQQKIMTFMSFHDFSFAAVAHQFARTPWPIWRSHVWHACCASRVSCAS